MKSTFGNSILGILIGISILIVSIRGCTPKKQTTTQR